MVCGAIIGVNLQKIYKKLLLLIKKTLFLL